ncbi:DUF2252 family protein [Bacillus paranthracis]
MLLSKIPRFVQTNIKKMMESPFNFYRGTTPLYYSDLRTGVIPIPAGWNQHPPIQTWLEGDAHAQNVAVFDDCEGTLRFDVTDFKNSYIGPFYWDTLRFMSSIFFIYRRIALYQGIESTTKTTRVHIFKNLSNNITKHYRKSNGKIQGTS